MGISKSTSRNASRRSQPETKLSRSSIASTGIGEEDHIVDASWSRSGKNLVLTVAQDPNWQGYAQVLLSPEQASSLAAFLLAGPDGST
jgi:hypothetical protein